MSSVQKKTGLLGAADLVATWTGRQRHAVIHEYREAVLKADFPGPQCLEPDELLDAVERGLPVSRLLHLEECEPCRELVGAAAPSDEKRRVGRPR